MPELTENTSPPLSSPASTSGASNSEALSADPKIKSNPLNYFFTILFAIWFAGTLLLFELIQRLAILVSPRLHELSIVGLNRSILFALKLAGVTFDTEYRYRPPADKPLIIISNHQSLFDIPLLHHTFVEHYPRYVAKKELTTKWIPSVTYNLRHGGNCIIDRSDPRQALPEIKRIGEWVNSNHRGIVIFPEGTRGRDGRLKQFKAGGLSALLRGAPDAEIVPVTIDNSWIVVARKFGPIPFGTHVKVIISPPLKRDENENADTVAQAAHGIIQQNLAAIRGVDPAVVLAPPKPAR